MTKQNLATILVSMVTLTVPLLTQAAEITGRIVGHECAHAGKVCPVDRLDPHLLLERDFVLVEPGGDYYFLSNIPRDIKIRHALETVTVVGEVDGKYKNIQVTEFNYDKNGKTKTAWSRQMEVEELEDLYEDYFSFRRAKQ